MAGSRASHPAGIFTNIKIKLEFTATETYAWHYLRCLMITNETKQVEKQDGEDLVPIKDRFWSSYAGRSSYLWGRGGKRKDRGQRSSSSAPCEGHRPLPVRRRTVIKKTPGATQL